VHFSIHLFVDVSGYHSDGLFDLVGWDLGMALDVLDGLLDGFLPYHSFLSSLTSLSFVHFVVPRSSPRLSFIASRGRTLAVLIQKMVCMCLSQAFMTESNGAPLLFEIKLSPASIPFTG
jgi:hypothetical protein